MSQHEAPSGATEGGSSRPTIRLLSGGAANGLVRRLEPRFTQETGFATRGDYGAVGGMVDRVKAGEAVDLVILTRANVDDLVSTGRVAAASVRDLGAVVTGIAVNHGQPIPAITDAASLSTVLAAASAIYVPDTRQSTAGRHVAAVLEALGLTHAEDGRLREFPNGMTAMRQMAADALPGAVGCTQVTEILATPGVAYAGDLPGEHALSTTYTAAISVAAAHPAEAAALIAILADPAEFGSRRDSGFS